jgi:HEAT repeat protein
MTNAGRTTSAPSPTDERIDPVRFEKAKDILTTLANAVSAMKLFPSEHATVKNFVDQLAEKFTAFLSTTDKLQIGIEEYSFTHGGQPAYTDEVAIKSLPFFFFKDGLQTLFFYQGLDRAEIAEFLELIKAEAQKGSEESDIVVALWERDFPNIQYYAPEEFLENRILGETGQRHPGMPDLPDDLAHERIEVRVDTTQFTQGRVDLDRGDREEVERAAALPAEPEGPGTPETGPAPEPGTGADDHGTLSPAAAMDPTLTEAELHALETMVRANRTISPEEEYINLMVEIVYLEDRPDGCRASLDTLLEYQFDQLQRGHFNVAVLVIQKVQELSRQLAGQKGKGALLEEFLKRTVSPKTVEAVKTLLDKKKALDWESLLGFFELIGASSLGLAADLYGIAPDGEARHKIVTFIEKMGGNNPGFVAGLADASRPALAREIVGVLSRLPGRRGIPHLSVFVNFQNKDIKAETIHVLAGVRDEMANRILAGFLNDPDEEVRIQATLSLDPAQGGARVEQILREASGREFQAKSLKEKEALLSFLGRTRSPEALEFLSRTLQRSSLFGTKRLLEVRLAAVAGLESMGNEGAREALQRGALGRKRSVREACRAALERLPPAMGPAS